MRTKVGVIPHIKKVSAVVLATIASLVLLASPTFALVGDVLISEFIADPVTISDANGEWIELENTTSSDIDITGWQLNDGGTAFVFTSPTIISANDFLVICRDIVLADANCDVEWPGMELTNTGDTITLKDTSSTPVDALIYASSNVVEGASTEVETEGNGNQVLAANTDIANTYTTDNTGTPGAANSLTLPVVNTNTGKEFNTIQAAIDEASPKDTIEIAQNNTFFEDINVYKPLTISGKNKWNTTVVIQNAYNGFNITADEVTVEGLKIILDEDNDNTAWQLKVSNQKDIVLKDLVLYGPGKNSGYAGSNPDNSGITGIDLNSVQNVLIENVHVEKFTKNGIAVTGQFTSSSLQSQNITFRNIISRNNGSSDGWAGIAFYTTSSQLVTTNISGVNFEGSNLISYNPIGLFVSGGGSVSSSSPLKLGATQFNDNKFNIVNGSPSEIDALGATFEGTSGIGATIAQRNALEANIYHNCEDSPYITGECNSEDTALVDELAAYLITSGSVNYATLPSPTAPLGLSINGLQCGGYTNVRNNTLSWNANSAEEDIVEYQLDIKDKDNHDRIANTVRPFTIRDEDGDYRYRLRAVNSQGSISNPSEWCSITLDREAPDATNVSPFDGGAIVNGASLTQQWSSSASDIDYYVYQSFNDDSGTSLRWQQNYNNTSKTANNVAESEYWWRVKAVDFAGNESAWTDLWMITVDNTAPVATIVTPLDTATVNGDVTVEGQVNDANPMNSFFRITGPNSYNQTSLFTDGRTTHIYTWDTNTLDDGTYTITFETRDRALNKDGNSVTTIEVYLDNTSPVVTFDGVSTINQSPELSGAIDDDTATVEVTVNGVVYSATVNSGTWTVPAGTISPNLSVNTYDVDVESTDPAGNVNTQNFPLALEIEAAPVVLSATTEAPNNPDTGDDNENSDGNVAVENTGANNQGGTGGEPFVAVQTTSQVEQSEPQVEGESTPEVLQENTSVDEFDVSNDMLIEENCFQIFGICWYWWLIPTAVLVAILYCYVIRKTDEE